MKLKNSQLETVEKMAKYGFLGIPVPKELRRTGL